MNRWAAVVPAAGYSSRMAQFKPLLAIGGETLTDRVIALFSRNDIDVFLVVGWQKEKLLAGLINQAFCIVENPDFASGMFTSIQAGVKSLGTHYQGFLVLPVDIPLVRPYTVRRLLEMSPIYPEQIVYPVCNKKRGHPPLIPSRLIPEIINWKGPDGLKGVLSKYETTSWLVEVPDENILLDLDTIEDFQFALEHFQKYYFPTENEQAAILDICQVDPARRRHCDKVAELAVNIGQALRQSGQKINLEIVKSAAVLHDIAREQPKHDEVGGNLLKEMGFAAVGDIVAAHTFLQQEPPGYELESRVVYLADKFVRGDKIVSLEMRFQASFQKFAVTAEIIGRIERRKQRAYTVKKELEELLHYPLETVVFGTE